MSMQTLTYLVGSCLGQMSENRILPLHIHDTMNRMIPSTLTTTSFSWSPVRSAIELLNQGCAVHISSKHEMKVQFQFLYTCTTVQKENTFLAFTMRTINRYEFHILFQKGAYYRGDSINPSSRLLYSSMSMSIKMLSLKSVFSSGRSRRKIIWGSFQVLSNMHWVKGKLSISIDVQNSHFRQR